MISTLFIITAVIGFMFLNAVKDSVKPIVFVILMLILISEYKSEAREVLDRAAEAGEVVAPHVKNAAKKGAKALNDFLNKDYEHDTSNDFEDEPNSNKGSALAQEVLGLN